MAEIEAMIDTFCEQQKKERELKAGNNMSFRYDGQDNLWLDAGAGSAPEIANKIIGSDFVSVDLNDDESKLIVDFDATIKPFVIEITGSGGTLTDAQFTQLITSYKAIINCDDEYYYLADDADGFMVYAHTGRDNQQQAFTKAIYVYTDTESELTYKTWAKVGMQVQSATIIGTTAPTTSTAGAKGQFYLDTTNTKLYICTAISAGSYTWQEVAFAE